MQEGQLIYWNRRRLDFTQSQLAEGICSVGQMSRIERGECLLTVDQKKVICKKLNISLLEEKERYLAIQANLRALEEHLSFADCARAKNIIDILQLEDFHYITPLYFQFQFLRGRYFILTDQLDIAKAILFNKNLNRYRFDQSLSWLLAHMRAYYYLWLGELVKARKEIDVIDPEKYGKPELYYHISLSCYKASDRTLALHYAEKAYRYYTNTNNKLKLIDVEGHILRLLSFEWTGSISYIEERYRSLLNSIERCGNAVQRTGAIANFASFYARKGLYEEAKGLMEQEFQSDVKSSGWYFHVRYTELKVAYLEQLQATVELVEKVVQLQREAKEQKELFYFEMLALFLIELEEGQGERYFLKLEEMVYQFPTYQFFQHDAIYVYRLLDYYLSNNRFVEYVKVSQHFGYTYCQDCQEQ
ncbi:MAG: helix-turn-helix domain-containing protein [Bacilli bacterium]